MHMHKSLICIPITTHIQSYLSSYQRIHVSLRISCIHIYIYQAHLLIHYLSFIAIYSNIQYIMSMHSTYLSYTHALITINYTHPIPISWYTYTYTFPFLLYSPFTCIHASISFIHFIFILLLYMHINSFT